MVSTLDQEGIDPRLFNLFIFHVMMFSVFVEVELLFVFEGMYTVIELRISVSSTSTIILFL